MQLHTTSLQQFYFVKCLQQLKNPRIPSLISSADYEVSSDIASIHDELILNLLRHQDVNLPELEIIKKHRLLQI